jgi:hypothetical protein
MPESLEARIRPFEHKDNGLVHFMIQHLGHWDSLVLSNLCQPTDVW